MSQEHYMSAINGARHNLERTVALVDQLPADYVADVLARSKARLARGVAYIEAHKGELYVCSDSTLALIAEAEASIAILEAR